MNIRTFSTPLFASAVAVAAFAVVPAAEAQVTIGNFAGGTAEAGWGHFDNGVQPLDSDVFTVTDLDTSGDGGALETNIAGFSDSFGYSFTMAGTVDDFFANDLLVFDVIYRGEATDDAGGGFDEIFQVLFQSNNNSFGDTTVYQMDANGDPLAGFGPPQGVTAVGFAAGDAAQPAIVTEVTIDYSSYKDTLPGGFDPSTLQFWFSTNDDNRPFKAIDNVRLAQAVPEPASLGLLGVAGIGLLRRRR